MTRTEFEAALAAANPLTDQAAAALPLRGAELELAERIAAIAVSRHPLRLPRRTPGRRRLGLLVAATVAVAVVVALLPSGQRDGGPAPAFAAPLVRFANASPLVLLQGSGWHVVYANEQPGGGGEIHFVRGPAKAVGIPQGASYRDQLSLAGRVASLSWGPAVRDQLNGHQALATGLGVTVHRLIYEGGTRHAFDISALFVDCGRGLQFRATVANMAMFRAELRALRGVDATTWLRAMPPSVVKSADSGETSVVKSADSGETIRQMLKGIPLPPGFDAARIHGARLLHERYQLGTAVTGTVACLWIADWSHARATGDQPAGQARDHRYGERPGLADPARNGPRGWMDPSAQQLREGDAARHDLRANDHSRRQRRSWLRLLLGHPPRRARAQATANRLPLSRLKPTRACQRCGPRAARLRQRFSDAR